MSIYEKRLDLVRAEMEKKGIGLIFLSPSANLEYLTGIRRPRPNATDTSMPGDWLYGVFIGLERGLICTVPRMASGFIKEQVRDKPWIEEVQVIGDREDPFPILQEILGGFDLQGKKVAIEDRAWTRFALRLSKIVPSEVWVLASELISPMRMIKDENEIALMKTAAHICDTILGKILNMIQPGVTEYDLAHEIDYQMVKEGAEGNSFTTGVSFWSLGRIRPASWIVRVTDKVLERGDSVTFDFGVVYQGYCSDFGRTVFIGEPTSEFRRIYDTVTRAQQEAIEAMKSGHITAEKADSLARGVIASEGYGEYFMHRLGHGIGSTVHEPPYLSEGDTTVLRAGMTFTVEPSIYIQGKLGARIEDVVLVTPDGGLPLNEFSRELQIIE